MPIAKNFLTFRQLDTALLHKGDLDENDVVPNLRIVMINNKLMKVYRLLDGLNDPWYHKSTTVTTASDAAFLSDATSPAISSAVGGVLTIASGVNYWKLGELVQWTVFSGAGAHLYSAIGRITAGAGTLVGTVGAAGLVTSAGSDTGSGGNKIECWRFGGATALTIDLSTLYVKDILRIFDNAYVGGKPRLFTPILDHNIFPLLHRDPFFDNRVGWFWLGNTIQIYVGSAATALATITMDYRGKPAPCTDFDSDVFIDIPPEENQMLMDEVLSEYLIAANKEQPADLQARLTEYQKRYEAAAADLQKTQTQIHGKRGA